MSNTVEKPTPRIVDNRPGLPEIKRRIGDFDGFKTSLHRSLSSRHRPGLAPFTARDTSDWTIAYLKGWASICDILSFYNERINNEYYLETVTEKEILQDLAARIGYEMTPASSAKVYLSFFADDMEDEDTVKVLGPGLSVKSVPGDDELPQTFETDTSLRLKLSWNEIRPLQTLPQKLSTPYQGFFTSQQDVDLRRGAPLIFGRLNLAMLPGDTPDPNCLHRVAKILPIENTDLNWIYIGQDMAVEIPQDIFPDVEAALLAEASELADLKAVSFDEFLELIKNSAWEHHKVLEGAQHLGLTAHDVAASISSLPLTTRFNTDWPYELTKRCRLFGHNVVTERAGVTDPPTPPISPVPTNPFQVNSDIVGTKPIPPEDNAYLYLDQDYPEITGGDLIFIRGRMISGDQELVESWTRINDRETVSVEAYGMSAEVTRISVTADWCGTMEGGVSLQLLDLRSVEILTATRKITLPEIPIVNPVGRDADGLAVNYVVIPSVDLDFAPGQIVMLMGERADLKGVESSEQLTLARIVVNSSTTILYFTVPLQHAYLRESVRLNANIAIASHGESVSEILGSGDRSQPFQKFPLKNLPVTFVTADTPSGLASTVQIYVDGIAWREVSSLHGQPPDARVFKVRVISDTQTQIECGDGNQGMRLSTGENNVVAYYRKGSGPGGLVKAGQLTLLNNKPRALKSVINALPSFGGSAAESMEDLRENAPKALLTMDRIVSRSDYEVYARDFAGLAKSHATWGWTGEHRQVLLTVAGEEGAVLPFNEGILPNLISSMKKVSPSDHRVTVKNYTPVYFTLYAGVKILDDHVGADGSIDHVLEAVQLALALQYNFDNRDLGEPVRASEVISAIQAVPGVQAVDLDLLYRLDQPAGLNEILRAARPAAGLREEFNGIELLMLSSAPLELRVMS